MNSIMEINEENSLKRCIRLKTEVIDKLNIAFDETTKTIVFWNKFQILVHDNLNFHVEIQHLFPEFIIYHLIVSCNHIICLNTDGVVLTIPLKCESNARKRSRDNFLPRQKCASVFTKLQNDILVLINKFDKYCLCLYRVNEKFPLSSKFELKYKNETWLNAPEHIKKYVLVTKTILESEFKCLKEIFSVKEDYSEGYSIVCFTCNRLNVYGCIINSKSDVEEINVLQLYSCPTEICDMQYTVTNDGLNLVLSLTIGTVIILLLKRPLDPAKIVHLNTAIHKFLVFKDTLLYTDGLTLWKTENSFTENIEYFKLFPKQVKDFVKYKDQLICTTYSSLLYMFSLSEESNMTHQKHDYCPSEEVISKSEHIEQIWQEQQKNYELLRKTMENHTYVNALTFSCNTHIRNEAMKCNIMVYETYDEVCKEHKNIILTENINEYFKSKLLILIHISIIKYMDILNEASKLLLNKAKYHITFLAGNKILQTTSINIKAPISNVKYLIPIDDKLFATPFQLNLRLIYNLPGVFETRQSLWPVMYAQDLVIKSEYLLRTVQNSLNVVCLKDPEEGIDNLILTSASNQFGQLFKFIDISNINKPLQWSMYVRLPTKYQEIFKNISFGEDLNTIKIKHLKDRLGSDKFLKLFHTLYFDVGSSKVTLKIIDNGLTNPMLMVASENKQDAISIRNFFGNIIYSDSSNCKNEIVPNSLYTTIENLKKSLTNYINHQTSTEDFLELTEQFQKFVIGTLPV